MVRMATIVAMFIYSSHWETSTLFLGTISSDSSGHQNGLPAWNFATALTCCDSVFELAKDHMNIKRDMAPPKKEHWFRLPVVHNYCLRLVDTASNRVTLAFVQPKNDWQVLDQSTAAVIKHEALGSVSSITTLAAWSSIWYHPSVSIRRKHGKLLSTAPWTLPLCKNGRVLSVKSQWLPQHCEGWCPRSHGPWHLQSFRDSPKAKEGNMFGSTLPNGSADMVLYHGMKQTGESMEGKFPPPF